MSTQSPAPSLALTSAVNVAPTRKPLPYSIKSAAAPVAGGGMVGRGVNVKSGDEYFIFEEGRQQQALTFQAVAAILYHGVVTREEVQALWDAADKASAPVAPATTAPRK